MPLDAILALANGTVFKGQSIGRRSGSSVGEVVFNTAITGYQEILTDPSYAKQLVTLTHPHIGNVGCNTEDSESDHVHCSGLIIRDLSPVPSNWRHQTSLPDYLDAHETLGITNLDTRALTRILRNQGSQSGCLWVAESITDKDVAAAISAATAFPGLANMDLAQDVTTQAPYQWSESSLARFRAESPATQTPRQGVPFRVVAMDFGVKKNILRMLVDRGCDVTVVPAKTTADEVLALKPDGIFLSNGPGDPEPCDYAIKAIQQFLSTDVPVFGICLGHQLLGLASGAKTKKMPHGHHGANHPVQNLKTGEVLITSQNHGFCIDELALPDHIEVTHVSLFDGTIQGISLKNAPAYSFQGHPEASPGPHDVAPLFDQFIHRMQERVQHAG
jgi:carbamoyl-phosphate synthase small subunit